MKTMPVLLAASLIANAALVAVTLQRTTGDKSNAPSSATAPAASRAEPTKSLAQVQLPPDLIEAINQGDAATLRDFLRSAGLSDDMIRTIVQMRLWKNYEARFKALHAQNENAPNKPWWKDDRNPQNLWNGAMTKEQRAEMRRLQREVRSETERLLGPDANPGAGWQDPKLAFLPADKRQALRDIQQDYQELMSEVQQDMQGFRLASDAEKLRFLQEEQKRDLESLMTPEERQAYELRMSNTAQQLRWKMTQYDATESEYLAIFPLQKAFDEKYNPQSDPFGYSDSGERDQNYWKERQAAEKQLQDQIKSLIGEQRFAESIRQQDNDWRQLEAATRRLELPADTPARLYALRDSASADVQKIAENPNLAADQKKAALAALAASTRDQVRASLGAEGADAYFKNNGMGWLKELERGNTIEFRQDSPGWNTKALPKDPKPPVAK